MSQGRSERVTGLYMISVAATLAGVHPQTLRIYEQRRLITPQRTPKGTRLYSDEDVQILRRIQELTDTGMNLTGVEHVFELEAQNQRLKRRVALLENQLELTRRDAAVSLERLRREFRFEIVPYRAPRQGLVPLAPSRTDKIPIVRPGEINRASGPANE